MCTILLCHQSTANLLSLIGPLLQDNFPVLLYNTPQILVIKGVMSLLSRCVLLSTCCAVLLLQINPLSLFLPMSLYHEHVHFQRRTRNWLSSSFSRNMKECVYYIPLLTVMHLISFVLVMLGPLSVLHTIPSVHRFDSLSRVYATVVVSRRLSASITHFAQKMMTLHVGSMTS